MNHFNAYSLLTLVVLKHIARLKLVSNCPLQFVWGGLSPNLQQNSSKSVNHENNACTFTRRSAGRIQRQPLVDQVVTPITSYIHKNRPVCRRCIIIFICSIACATTSSLLSYHVHISGTKCLMAVVTLCNVL